MVRLVFRPYTQVRRTICTSVSLRSSTRVSSGFALLRHSSPSFGSQHARCHSNPCAFAQSRRVMHALPRSHDSISLRLRGCRPRTRVRVRLLGPCFKTGRESASSQRRVRRAAARARDGLRRGARGTRAVPRRANASGPLTVPGRCPACPAMRSFGSLASISSAFSLSFQSTFHLSLAVLFCYWALARI